MLEVKNLNVTYGGVLPALRNVSISVPAHGVVALLGSNGAGKTTLLRAISNNLKPHSGNVDSGTITFNGEDLRKLDSSKIIGRNVVQVPEGRRIFGRLSVEENLRIGAIRRKNKEADKAREHVYELFPKLYERRKQRGLLLSGGEQQMLAIGRALMAKPKLLMLDEPSLGLAPMIVETVAEVIKDINEEGTSILIIEQNASMALNLADYAYVLDVGAVSLEGKSSELQETDEIKDLYLGHGGGDSDEEAAVDLGDKVLYPWKGAS